MLNWTPVTLTELIAGGPDGRRPQLNRWVSNVSCQLNRWVSNVSCYYESESDHPPANLLADLARALNVSTDQLLSDAPPAKRPAKASLSPRLERRLKQIEQLSPKSKQQLLNIIDTFIEAEALKQRSSR